MAKTHKFLRAFRKSGGKYVLYLLLRPTYINDIIDTVNLTFDV